MTYDFHKLKTIKCFDSVTIRVPRRWNCGPDHKLDGFWSCYEDGVETGTLWLHLDFFSLPEEVAVDLDFDFRNTVNEIIEGNRKEFGPFLESKISDIDEGYLWYRAFEGEEEGENLRYFRYMYFQRREKEMAFTDFNLVLPIKVLKDPEIQDLVGIMDREIRAAKVNPFSGETIDEKTPFGPMKRVNFDDQVVLELPEAVQGRAEGEHDNQWYCFFEPDNVEARMWVITHDMELLDEKNRKATSIVEEAFEEVLEDYLTDENDKREVSRVPGGALAYDIYDDEKQIKPEPTSDDPIWREGPLSNHLWRYIRFGNGKARVAQFLLMLPRKRAETDPLLALVKLLDREIRRAEFPGFDVSDS